MNRAVVVGVLVMIPAVLASQSPVQQGAATVSFPDDYRSWTHVKSSMIAPAHQNYAVNGGFQHVYANQLAMAGYRSRVFPEGSVVVVDWLGMNDTNGAVAEGPRRQLDVMVKDSVRFKGSGGWGFQRFSKDTKEFAPAPTPQQCFACHSRLAKDGLVLSSYRP